MLTMFDDDDSVFAAMRAGPAATCLRAPSRMRSSEPSAPSPRRGHLRPGVAARVLDHLIAPPRGADPLPELTPREREVLGLIAAGLGNAIISARLGLSPKTVSNHVSNLFAKLQIATRAEAVARAGDAGLGGGRDRAPDAR